jgi:hypothetical protein
LLNKVITDEKEVWMEKNKGGLISCGWRAKNMNILKEKKSNHLKNLTKYITVKAIR